MPNKRALIIGIAGQDGSYLSELLLEKGYEVYGMVRGAPEERYDRLEPFRDRLELLQGDLMDQSSLEAVLRETQPDEVYNLAAPSFVPTSWTQPALTSEFIAIGVTRLLEAIRNTNPETRFYQASSSEMFGNATQTPQNEETPFKPRSPYGAAKVYAHHMIDNYRERYAMYAVSGILYNHESPRRGLEFVTRKVTNSVAQIKLGKSAELRMGSMDAVRDWGYAGDYVRAMWLMLQQDTPDDYVIATGKAKTVQDLVSTAFSYVGLDWENHVVIDEKFVRPPEEHILLGDPSKAMRQLGWQCETSFEQMIHHMIDVDVQRHCG